MGFIEIYWLTVSTVVWLLFLVFFLIADAIWSIKNATPQGIWSSRGRDEYSTGNSRGKKRKAGGSDSVEYRTEGSD
jgi:hypothetical protein